MSQPTSPPGVRVVLALPRADAASAALAEEASLTVVATAATAVQLQRQASAVRPDVVLLHTALPHADAGLVAVLTGANIPVVLLVDAALRQGDDLLAGPPYPPSVLARAERLGCLGVTAWPPLPDELLLRAEQAAAHAHLLAQLGPLGGHEASSAATGGTIALLGEAGGSGKTLLAANLAAFLGVVCERRVALLDLDLLRASLHDTLGLLATPGHDLEALHAAAAPRVAEATARLDQERRASAAAADLGALYRSAAVASLRALDLAPYVIAYPPNTTGPTVDVILGVTTPEGGECVAGDLMTLHSLVDLLRERYDDVVLDLGTGGELEWHEELASRADTLLVVTGPLPDTVERVARGYVRLRRHTGLAPARCRIVVNHAPTDERALLPLHRIAGRFQEAGAPALAGVVAHDSDLVGRARLTDPDHALLPVLLAEEAARRSRFVRGIEEVVRHLRPGLLPERERGTLARVHAVAVTARAALRSRIWRGDAQLDDQSHKPHTSETGIAERAGADGAVEGAISLGGRAHGLD